MKVEIGDFDADADFDDIFFLAEEDFAPLPLRYYACEKVLPATLILRERIRR